MAILMSLLFWCSHLFHGLKNKTKQHKTPPLNIWLYLYYQVNPNAPTIPLSYFPLFLKLNAPFPGSETALHPVLCMPFLLLINPSPRWDLGRGLVSGDRECRLLFKSWLAIQFLLKFFS